MKDFICANVGTDHIYECTTKYIGRAGENQTTQLQITLAEELSGCAVFLDFKKPKGGKYRTEQLTVTDNVATYDVPMFLLNEAGEIKVQLVLVNENNEVWKSSVKKYYNLNSVNASEDVPMPTDFKVEVRKQIADLTDALNGEINRAKSEEERIAEEVTKNSMRLTNLEAGIPDEDFVEDSDVAYIKDVPTNALPYAELKKLGGMTYKDGDTLKHAVVTEVERVGANLIPFPYKFSSFEENGVKFGIDAEQRITLYGTCLGSRELTFAELTLPIGSYTFSATQTSDYTRSVLTKNGTALRSQAKADNAYKFTVDSVTDIYAIVIVILSGNTYSNDIVAPMINSGNTALPYRPYTKTSLPIPEAVRNLDGYGQSNPDNSEEYNYIDFDAKRYVALGHVVDGAWVAYDTVQVIDLTDILSADNFIAVEGGGTLTFKNENEFAVPSTVVYQVKSEVSV